jgi:hypothetical protein
MKEEKIILTEDKSIVACDPLTGNDHEIIKYTTAVAK